MPVVMQKNKVFPSLFALDVNHEFKYPKYFSVLPTGPNTKTVVHRGLLQGGDGAESEAARRSRSLPRMRSSRNNACEGARENAKKYNLKVVYDKTYPPSTTDFTPIVRAMQAANADIVIICSYPLSSVGMVKTINELNYKPKMIGGAMVGLQATVFKKRLGRQAQRHRQLRDLGAVGQDDGAGPGVLRQVPGARRRRRRRPARLLSRRLGLCLSQHVSVRRSQGAKSIEDDKVADYFRKNTFKTIMGDWSYGPNGEWTKSGMMQVQYHSIKERRSTWKGMNYQTVLTPGRDQDRQPDLSLREGQVGGIGLLRELFSSANMAPRGDDPRGVSHSRIEKRLPCKSPACSMSRSRPTISMRR